MEAHNFYIAQSTFYFWYLKIDNFILDMELVLSNFRIKNPSIDVTDRQNKINDLKLFRERYAQLFWDYEKVKNVESFWIMDRSKLLARIAQLERENESLKQNLKL